MERSEVDLAGFCELFEAEAVAAGGKLVGADVLAMLRGEASRPLSARRVRP
jgi:hypothetical protein